MKRSGAFQLVLSAERLGAQRFRCQLSCGHARVLVAPRAPAKTHCPECHSAGSGPLDLGDIAIIDPGENNHERR